MQMQLRIIVFYLILKPARAWYRNHCGERVQIQFGWELRHTNCFDAIFSFIFIQKFYQYKLWQVEWTRIVVHYSNTGKENVLRGINFVPAWLDIPYQK